MLQTLQLGELSRTFAADVAELRAFLRSAGVPLDEGGSLQALATRLAEDRSVRRDLVGYLWLMLERQEGLRSAELLGVLALSAAGERFAVSADEEVAHALLRFVMETRRTFAGSATAAREVFNTAGTPEPAVWQDARTGVAGHHPDPVFVSHAHSTPTRIAGRTRVRFLQAAVAACLLGLAGVALLHVRHADRTTGPPAATPTSPGSTAPASSAVLPPVAERDIKTPSVSLPPERRSAQWSKQTARPPQRSRVLASAAPVRSSSGAATVAPGSSSAAMGISSEPAAVSSGMLGSPRAARPTAPLPASPGIVPNAVLNKQLAVPVDTAAYDPAYAVDPKHPRLHRRPAKPDGTLMASVEPMPTSMESGSMGSARVPIVRQTSLGMMAANLLYSPPAAYPRAASAQHVQGQVKLQTEIDRDGNVASARVISGPPLLRDAALEAVLQWRYRPYTVRNKPAPTTDTAVLEFELP